MVSKNIPVCFPSSPVHCSWMNQVEVFSILQRKRLRIADFADKQALAERLERVHCWSGMLRHIRLIGAVGRRRW